MKKFLILLFVALFTLNAKSQKPTNKEWNELILSIMYVESRFDATAVNANGDCVGIMQITPIVVKDCNEYLKMKGKNKKYTLQDRYNKEKSVEMFNLIQERYNPSRNIEKAIRIWNGGCRYSVKKTEKYYTNVIKEYKRRMSSI